MAFKFTLPSGSWDNRPLNDASLPANFVILCAYLAMQRPCGDAANRSQDSVALNKY